MDFHHKWISIIFRNEIFGIPNISYTLGLLLDEVVECNSFEGVYFQYYNHKRYPAQPTKDEMERTACVELPPWKKRGSDFIWDPEN